MFILFYGVIFDPAELVYAHAHETCLELAINGHPSITRIWCESEAQSVHLIGELYQHMLESGIAQGIEDGPEIELDGDELEMLEKARNAGYKWVARDKTGLIYAYRKKPIKRKNSYEDPNTVDPMRLESDWFSEIDFEAGPYNIDFLLVDN